MSTDAATAVLSVLRDRVQALHEAHAAAVDTGAAPARLADAAGRTAALLEVTGEVVDRARTADVRDGLGRLAGAAAAVRDAVADREAAAGLLDGLPRALVVGPVSDRLRHVLTERIDALAATLDDAVGEASPLLTATDRLVVTPPLGAAAGRKAERVLTARVRTDDEELATVVAAARAADTGAAAQHRPALRDAAALLAASAGAAGAVRGKRARRLAAAADDVAGAVRDVEAAVRVQRVVVDVADLAHRHREPGFTYGLVHAAATRAADAAGERLEEALAGWASAKRRWLRE